MANKTCKLYIRSKVGYRKPPKRLADLPENETFVLLWYEGKAKKAKTVGRYADKAQTALIDKEAALRRASVTGTDTVAASTPTSEREKLPIRGRGFLDAVNVYLSEVKRGKSKKTHLAYSATLEGFSKVCKAETIEAMTREDVLKYTDRLRDSRLTPCTIANRLAFLMTFFKHFDLAWPMLKTDRVKFTDKTVEAYSLEDLHSPFSAANQEELELFRFLLGTPVPKVRFWGIIPPNLLLNR
jgi:Phage integrase, N-terminal SAM-like domain